MWNDRHQQCIPYLTVFVSCACEQCILYLTVALCPVIASTTSIFRHVHVLRIVEISKRRIHYRVNHSWFQVQQHCSRYIVLIIGLTLQCTIVSKLHVFYLRPFTLTHLSTCMTSYIGTHLYAHSVLLIRIYWLFLLPELS